MKKILFYALLISIVFWTGCVNNSEEDPIEDMSFDCSQSDVSLANEIMPLLLAQCTFSGCHNGDNGSSRDWTQKENILEKASGIKTRTQNGSMPRSPGSLSQNEIDLIACWVDNGAKDN